MVSNEKICGGCLCGEVRYEVAGPAFRASVCYCESCTRAAGAPATPYAGFKKSQFRVLSGHIKIYESSPGVNRGFCGRCGTSLTYQKDPNVLEGVQDDMYITIRTLDDPSAHPPDEHEYYGERVSWVHVDDGLPRYEHVNPKHLHLAYASTKIIEDE